MSNYKNVAAEPGLGGVFIDENLASLVRCETTITLDWADIPSGVVTRLHNTIKQGFTTIKDGTVPSLLRLFQNMDGVPACPTIGYFGKKYMNVLVPKGKARGYVTDLIAAGHMVDIDLSDAASTYADSEWIEFEWLRVDGWKVQPKAPATSTPKAGFHRYHRRSGADLAPATSKLTTLVRSWTAELMPQRLPFLRWVEAKHPLTFHLSSKP
jgi:hypothetical protein